MANKHFEEFAQDCANKLASQIEAGKAPWELGGVPASYPVDAISGKPLQGITALQLMVREKTSGFEDNRWLTPSQIAVLGASVKKGARGVPSVGWNEGLEGEFKPTKIPQTYYNVEQCENFKKPLPELLPIEQQPKAQFEDMCALLGYTNKGSVWGSGVSAYVNGRNELILAQRSSYESGGRDSDKKYELSQLRAALDGIRAITDARVYDNFQELLESKQTDKETPYFLRENLARAFMQSHIGSKLPKNLNDFTPEEIIEQNKDIADLIRTHPSILFEAAADASKVVNRTIEKSEQKYIIVDFERQEVKRLTASQSRDYVAQELNQLKLSGTILHDPYFRELQTNLHKQGYFNPYQTLTKPLYPDQKSEDSLCRKINHCGFAFVEENQLTKDKENLSYESLNLLNLTHARSPRLGSLTEDAFIQSLIENGIGFTKKRIEEQLSKLDRSSRPDVSDALSLWDSLSYDRRRAQNPIVTRVSCWIVNFDTNRIEGTTIEDAVSNSLNLIEKWAAKTPTLSCGLRQKLLSQFGRFKEERGDRNLTRNNDLPLFGTSDPEKEIALCDQFLNPSRSGENDLNGNVVLRDLDRKGLVICRNLKEVLEASSWQGKGLEAQAEAIIHKLGLHVGKAKELSAPQSPQEAQQRFNDFCCAQKTFYSVETARRRRSEEQTIRQILQGASPEKIQEIKELIKAEIERIAKSSQKNVQKNEVIQPVRTQSGMER